MIAFVFITYAQNYGGATKVTYPSGYAVTNVYDDYGNLTAVKNGETLLWQWKELDKTGALTKNAVCGSVVRTRIWNKTMDILLSTSKLLIMRYLCFILEFVMCNSVIAQKYMNIDKPFQDSVSSGVFTESENEFLNKAFLISKKIDFNDMKVCFLSGNAVPYTIISKECFFRQYKGIGVLYLFDEKEKEEANGYDIAISVFTKKMPMIEDMPRYIRKAEKRKLKYR